MTIEVVAKASVVVAHPSAGTLRSAIIRRFVYENVSPFMPGVGEHGEQIAVPIPDFKPSTFSPDIADVPGLCRRIFDGEAHWALLDISKADFTIEVMVTLPPTCRDRNGNGYTTFELPLSGDQVKFALLGDAYGIAERIDAAFAHTFGLWHMLRLPEVQG